MSAVGRGHPAVIEAMHAQLGRLEYAHTSFFTSEPAEELAAELISHAPAGLSRVYCTCGGSEAAEAALKIARQYFVESPDGVTSLRDGKAIRPCCVQKPAGQLMPAVEATKFNRVVAMWLLATTRSACGSGLSH